MDYGNRNTNRRTLMIEIYPILYSTIALAVVTSVIYLSKHAPAP
jgi:hypothetical protein